MKTLKELREQRNKTQKNMAEALNISESYYSLLENGKRELSLRHANLIAKELGVTIDQIFLLTSFAESKVENSA